MASSHGMSTRATSSDQRSPRDKLAASSILSGGIRRGSSFLKAPRNLGVGTKTVMPRRSASARNGRCGESGLTLMAVALFHGSMLKSRAAATSAPAKFGIRPCGGNGQRATPSATSLSQTHCRAALLSAKSRAMTEIPARVAQCPHERRSGARGRCLFAHRGKPGWHSAAVFEAPALVAGFDDFTMMGETIEERGRHLGVAKHTGPIAKGQIGGDDNGSALVKPADQMKEQLAAGLSERQVAELVENNEVDAGEIFGEPPLPAGAGLALQPVDEVDDGVEAAPGAATDA